MNESKKQQKKERKKYYIKLKNGSTYIITADYMRYEEESEDNYVLYFHKKIPRQKNSETKDGTYIVAFVKDKDVEVMGLESFILSDAFPMTNNAIKYKIFEVGLQILSGVLIALVARKLKK